MSDKHFKTNHRYFTVDTQWLEEFDSDAVVLYGLLKNISNKTPQKRYDSNGGVYYRIANKVIQKFSDLSKYKIKQYLKYLEENGFITIYTLKKQTETFRYIKFNFEQRKYGFALNVYYDMLYDNEDSLNYGLVYSYLIFDHNVNGNYILDTEEMFDVIGVDWSTYKKRHIIKQLISENYIKVNFDYTEDFLDICDDYHFEWLP